MMVPQAMAYALLAGLEPIMGLYASTIPLLLYALVGSSGQLAVGPVALDSILVGAALIAVGVPEHEFAATAGLLAIMTGGLLVLLGSLRMGVLASLLTPPVVAGFTTAAAVVIGTSQFPHMLGIKLARTDSVLLDWIDIFGRLDNIKLWAVVVGLSCLVGLLVLKAKTPRVPRYLVVVAASILVSWAFRLPIPQVGDVPAGLPFPRLPHFSTDLFLDLAPYALVLGLVAMMESISIGRHFADLHGTSLDANQELLGVGMANIGSGLIGGYNVAGGFSRSAVHGAAGAKTTRALAFTALGVTVALIGFTKVLAFLPKATLAAIVLASLSTFIKHEVARDLYENDRPGLVLFVVTMVTTLTFGIVEGMLAGVCLDPLVRWAQASSASASANQ